VAVSAASLLVTIVGEPRSGLSDEPANIVDAHASDGGIIAGFVLGNGELPLADIYLDGRRVLALIILELSAALDAHEELVDFHTIGERM
jgi:hypothetical protein